MKAEKFKRWIIKKAGGYTKKEYEDALIREPFPEPIIHRRPLHVYTLKAAITLNWHVDIQKEEIEKKLCNEIAEGILPYLEFEETGIPNQGKRIIAAELKVINPNG